MRHRQLTQQAKGVPFNQVALKFIGYVTLFCVIIAAIVQVWANADWIDKKGNMIFGTIGVMFLATVGVYWAWRKVTGRI